jgi:hypothetical protein
MADAAIHCERWSGTDGIWHPVTLPKFKHHGSPAFLTMPASETRDTSFWLIGGKNNNGKFGMYGGKLPFKPAMVSQKLDAY